MILRRGCISVLVLFIIIAMVPVGLWAATSSRRPDLTAELIQAAHRVLDLGYDCAKSGAERAACHAQLTTAIKDHNQN